MRTIATISLWIVRIAGIVQLAFGAMFWTGRALTFIPFHVIVGSALVLALWTLAGLAFVARTRRALATFAVLWGLALPAVGAQQATLLIGSMHWIVRVVHLLMGVAAIGLAVALGRAVLTTSPAPARRSDRAPGAALARPSE